MSGADRGRSIAAPVPASAGSAWTTRASSAGVFASNTAIAGSDSSSAALIRLRSSTAVSESNPDSRKPRSGSTSAGPL